MRFWAEILGLAVMGWLASAGILALALGQVLKEDPPVDSPDGAV